MILLLAPLWPSRPWFPRLLSLLVEIPKRFSGGSGPSSVPFFPFSIISTQTGCIYALASIRESGQEAGLSKRAVSFTAVPSVSPLDVLTIPDWQVFVNGVPVRRAIHVQLL